MYSEDCGVEEAQESQGGGEKYTTLLWTRRLPQERRDLVKKTTDPNCRIWVSRLGTFSDVSEETNTIYGLVRVKNIRGELCRSALVDKVKAAVESTSGDSTRARDQIPI